MQYEIKGGNLPVLLCRLEAGENMLCESGAMSWMDDGIEMETQSGGIGKMFGRMFTNEKLFQNRYVAKRPGEIAFASSFPGSILPVRITPDKPIVVQKSAFLASSGNVDLSVHFQKKLGSGLFGGEGFVLQRISGDGIAFLEIDGSSIEYELAAGERKVLSTGYLAMMDASCTIDVQTVKGVKNVLFGGEGLFNTVITGPGHAVLQTMPIMKTAASLYGYMPHTSSN